VRGQYSRKPAPRTMSADMDKWERDQQRKHTEAKRVRRTFRRLGRELTQSSQNMKSSQPGT
jgi:hypothetical protein